MRMRSAVVLVVLLFFLRLDLLFLLLFELLLLLSHDLSVAVW